VKTDSLEVVVGRFSGRVSKLPVELQAIFWLDLEVAVEHRLRVLENVAFE
jgi:hypothetical protein